VAVAKPTPLDFPAPVTMASFPWNGFAEDILLCVFVLIAVKVMVMVVLEMLLVVLCSNQPFQTSEAQHLYT
jgi:hypothetical protein